MRISLNAKEYEMFRNIKNKSKFFIDLFHDAMYLLDVFADYINKKFLPPDTIREKLKEMDAKYEQIRQGGN